MKEKRISLYGGEEYNTEGTEAVIKVDSGTALVYLVPVALGRCGRKLLLAEAPEGSQIPSLSYTDEQEVSWSYKIMALDRKTELLICPSGDRNDAVLEFVRLADIQNVDRLGYEEACAEIYRMYQVKDDAFIYQAEKDSRHFYNQTLRDIYESLKKSRNQAYQRFKHRLTKIVQGFCLTENYQSLT